MTVYVRKWKRPDGSTGESWYFDVSIKRPGEVEPTRYRGAVPGGCTSRRLAETFERTLIASIIDGSYHEAQLAAQKPKCRTLKDFAPVYIEACKAVGSRSSAREVRSKQAVLDRYLVPFFGSDRLDEISTERIDKFMEHQRTAKKPKGGSGFSPKTITNHVTVLSGLLRLAIDRGLVDRMPRIRWPKLPKPLPRYYSFEQADALIEASKAEPFWHAMIVVALKCGLRIGELQALEWRHVDLRRGVITVEQAFSKTVLKPPKNGKPRTVDLAPSVIDVLTRHPRRLGSPWVWPSDDGDALKQNEVKHPMWRALERAGLPPDQWHICRHTFCSHLIMRGVHLATVMELAGHSSFDMTLRYAHLAPHVHREAVATLDMPFTPTAPTSKKRRSG